jgi:hypothetical protein
MAVIVTALPPGVSDLKQYETDSISTVLFINCRRGHQLRSQAWVSTGSWSPVFSSGSVFGIWFEYELVNCIGTGGGLVGRCP